MWKNGKPNGQGSLIYYFGRKKYSGKFINGLKSTNPNDFKLQQIRYKENGQVYWQDVSKPLKTPVSNTQI